MTIVETFKGRCSPLTGAPVVVELMRMFNQKTLQDTWAIKFSSGKQEEYYGDLTPSAAQQKWKYAVQWWA